MADKVADELAIRELVARYADAVVRRDEDAWAATWTKDGEWHVLGEPARGREAVVELWNKLMAGLPFVVQLAHGGMIQLDGDRATGRWYITEHGKTPDGTGMFTLGVYHDDYERSAEGWRFARRRFDFLYAGPPDLSAPARGFPKELP
jgi:uncharacterized protein (TIGR02246 family)